MTLKEALEAIITSEAVRLQKKAADGLLGDDDVARLPQLARAAQIIQELKDTRTLDQRTQDELEALVERGGQGRG